MPALDFDSETLDGAIRNAWLVATALLLIFVGAPSFYLYLHGTTGDVQFDPRVNLIEIIRIAGSASSLAFYIIAVRFSAKRRKNRNVSPVWMQRALFSGLIATLIYWFFFLLLMSAGSDGDGIMRGWMIILYPFLIVWYVLLVARRT